MTDSRSSGLWSRIRDARVLELLGVYAGGSFGLLQVADIFVERLGLPDWTFFGLVVLLVLGVPLALITAWVQRRSKEEGRTLPDASDSGAPSGSPHDHTSGLRRVFTWKNTMLAGGGSVIVLALLVATFMAMRTLGIGPVGSLVAAGVLDREEPILIADFQSQAGDSLLAGALTEAFRIDFEQSELVRVVGPGTVREGLSRMQLPPDAALTPEVARNLALREGIKAVLVGEINPAGRGSIISVRLIAPETEETVASFRESIDDEASVIAAVDRLSNRMRERIGESLRSIRGGEPLERVSTASLPALRLYSQGVRAVELERKHTTGIRLLEDAIAQDSTFAMAWRKLGVALSNAGYPRERWEEAYTRAYQNRDRLTDRERYLTQAIYYSSVLGDEDRAIAAYRAVLDRYPAETTALNNLAVLLGNRGDRAAAADLYRRALAIDSTRSFYYTNLLVQEVALGEWEAAGETHRQFQRRFAELPTSDLVSAQLAASRGEYDRARELLERVREHPRTNVQDRANAIHALSRLALLHGRLAQAERLWEEASSLRERLGWEPDPLMHELRRTWVDLLLVGDTVAAVSTVNELVVGGALQAAANTTPGNYLEAAILLVLAGELARAEELVAQFDALSMDEGMRRMLEEGREDVDILFTAGKGDVEEAVSRLRRRQTQSGCGWCLEVVIGWVYDRAGNTDATTQHLESFVRGPWLHRLELDSQHLATTHRRLGDLYREKGDVDAARHHYARFIDLWEGADPELQPQVQEVRRLMGALEGDS